MITEGALAGVAKGIIIAASLAMGGAVFSNSLKNAQQDIDLIYLKEVRQDVKGLAEDLRYYVRKGEQEDGR